MNYETQHGRSTSCDMKLVNVSSLAVFPCATLNYSYLCIAVFPERCLLLYTQS